MAELRTLDEVPDILIRGFKDLAIPVGDGLCIAFSGDPQVNLLDQVKVWRADEDRYTASCNLLRSFVTNADAEKLDEWLETAGGGATIGLASIVSTYSITGKVLGVDEFDSVDVDPKAESPDQTPTEQ